MVNFEKTAKSLLAAGVLMGSSIENTNANNLEGEIEKYSPKYNHAVSEMYERVETLENEFGAIRVMDDQNQERFYWIKSKDSSSIYFDSEKINKILSNNPKELEFFHTHPNHSETIIRDQEDGNIRPQPPSTLDFNHAIQFVNVYKDVDVKFNAIDNNGVWSYLPDINNEKIKILYQHSLKLKDFILGCVNESLFQSSPDFVQFIYRIDRADFRDLPLSKEMQGNFTPELKKKWDILIESRIELEQECPEINIIENFEMIWPTEEYEKDSKKFNDQYINACKKIGIDIKFKPIDTFKN